MIEEYLLQILLVAEGIWLFVRTMNSLARKTMTEAISMFWSFLAIVFVLGGIALIPLQWSEYLSLGALIIVAVAFALVMEGMYYLSQQLSHTIRKTQELAMQISLLNQEHLKVDGCLSGLSGRSRNEIWRTNTVAEPKASKTQKEETPHEECSVCH